MPTEPAQKKDLSMFISHACSVNINNSSFAANPGICVCLCAVFSTQLLRSTSTGVVAHAPSVMLILHPGSYLRSQPVSKCRTFTAASITYSSCPGVYSVLCLRLLLYVSEQG